MGAKEPSFEGDKSMQEDMGPTGARRNALGGPWCNRLAL